MSWLECFSIECHRAKTKVILITNQKKEKIFKSQWELKVKTTKLPKVQKMLATNGVIGFSLASDWLRKWWKFCRSILTEGIKAKPKQFWITFDTQLKIALFRFNAFFFTVHRYICWYCEFSLMWMCVSMIIMYMKDLRASDWLKMSAFLCNTNAKK